VADLESMESLNGTRRDWRRLAAGGALVGIGGLLGLAGALLLGSVGVSATRRWVSQMEQPPAELAKRTWRQARIATAAGAQAGAQAWRDGPTEPSRPAPAPQRTSHS